MQNYTPETQVTQYETTHDRKPTYPILPNWLYRAREASEKAWKRLDDWIESDYAMSETVWSDHYHKLLQAAIRTDSIAVQLGTAYHSGLACECEGYNNCYLCSLISAIDKTEEVK